MAALAEPTRRRLYDHVVRQAAPVSRDERPRPSPSPAPTAAFHLDRLVDDGLLEVDYERRTGRTGPGAGRPSKLYRRAECTVAVSLPERRYDLAGGLLAAAMAEAEESGERPAACWPGWPTSAARELAAEAARARRDAALRVLEEHGFEPRAEDGEVSAGQLPVPRPGAEHTELVCGMNLRLLEGVLDGRAGAGLAPRLRRARAVLRAAGVRPTESRGALTRVGGSLLQTIIGFRGGSP